MPVEIKCRWNTSGSESKYEMENLSERQKQLLIKFYNEHPKPVYHIKEMEIKIMTIDKKIITGNADS